MSIAVGLVALLVLVAVLGAWWDRSGHRAEPALLADGRVRRRARIMSRYYIDVQDSISG